MAKLSEDLYVDKLYKEGYVPSSFDSPHSSLHRSITWVGMGLILASVAGFGTLVFGAAVLTDDINPWGMPLLIGGAIMGVGLFLAGAVAIHIGRGNYRDYKKRTGRIH